MPEGDTIRRLADSLTAKFAGSEVVSSRFRHPRLATVDLGGATFVEADARGKHLLMRFSNDYSIHVHLRMDGSVYNRFVPEVAASRRKFEIQLNSGWITAVDIPVLEMQRTKREQQVVGHLGPDICGNYDHESATSRFRSAGSVPVTQAMLDQQVVAGFGNIYAVETPFIVGINPYTQVDRLSNASGLLTIGVGLIRTNARFGPQNTTGKRLSRSEHWVLSRKIFQCKVCGEHMQRVAGRDSPWKRRHAWCPRCQPAENTEVDLDRAAELLALHPCREIVDLAQGKLIADVSHPVRSERLTSNEGGRKRMK